mgnify:CR=1 FL=1
MNSPHPEDVGYSSLLGESPAMTALRQTLRRIEGVPNTTVLLLGESGTGKELAAQAIHAASTRRGHPFQTVDCTGLTGDLALSQLFGHEAGAFTGARVRRSGLIEAAGMGTLFLDEVGELDAATQAALLRVLDSQTYRPLGSNDVFRTHVRVVAATNRDLATEVAEGRFRRDLFHRLDVLTVRLPPLRERRTDIELLATHFLEQFDGRGPRAPRRLADDALQVLQAWRWPGNVRELRNAIERAVVLAPGPRICLGDLPEALRPRSRRPIRPSSLNLSEAEARLVRSAMERAKGNQTDAAKLLGISRPALRRRLSRLGLLPKQGDSA